MPVRENDTEIRSEAVQEILGIVPNWMVRWGNVLILFLFIGMCLLSYFIKYPDTVGSKITIDTNNATENIYADLSGKFSTLNVNDGTIITPENVLGVIENNDSSVNLSSSNTGRIYFADNWKESSGIIRGDLLFRIVPNNFDFYIGKMLLLDGDAMKVVKNQMVKIRLPKSSTSDFYIIEGVVFNKTLITDENGNITIDIRIGKELRSANGEVINYKPGMEGNADIIVEDLRLIERLFYQLRNVFQ